MHVFKEKEALNSYLSSYHDKNLPVGFAPTMGALHDGHLSLVEESKKHNAVTVVSIFVNPTQFDNQEDLSKYPKTLESDLALLQKSNCDVVFVPEVTEMYNSDISSKHFDFEGLEKQMEGAFRKGHFDGVGTVVKLLFDIVKPTHAYFGEKDFQQLQVIKKLVKLEGLQVNIVGCPIYREPNGLAMSSRNQRLSPKEKQEAGFIYTILNQAKINYPKKTILELNNWVKEQFENHPLLKLEYFTIADEETLNPVTDKKESNKPRAFIAAYYNTVRLIDNLSLHSHI